MDHFWNALLLFQFMLVVDSKIQNAESFLGELNFKSSDGFLINGIFERSKEVGKEFWLCLDYDFDASKFNETLPAQKYPEKECGGVSMAQKRPYWFALKGQWLANGSIWVDFVNTLDLKVRSISWSDKPESGKFSWKVAVEAQKNAPSIVYFNGLGDVEIPPMDSSSQVHVRIPSEQGVQILNVSPHLNPVILDQLTNYHLLSEILKGDDTVLMRN